MRSIGVITLLSVGAISAAPTPRTPQQGPVVTVDSTASFADCSKDEQRQRAAGSESLINNGDEASRPQTHLTETGSNTARAKAMEECI